MPPETTSRFSSWRFIIAFFATVLLVFGAYVSWKIYEFQQGQEWVKNVAEGLKQWEREQYDRAMADTYGGRTPEETLQMYISAVEKKDYELASRYLIEGSQEEERSSLFQLEEKRNLEQYILIIKSAKIVYFEKNIASMESEIENSPSYRISFIKYPNDIWKISDI